MIDDIYVKACYYGWITNYEELMTVSSGGAASKIGEYVINTLGGVVFGAVYSDDYRTVQYACADKVEL